jgi:hypothetical protein
MMKTMSRFKSAVTKSLAASLMLAPIFSTAASMGVPVRIHAVNYSDQEFKYVVVDPNDSSNIVGGESISGFGTGGSICCYILAEKWHERSKVKIAFKLIESTQSDRNLPEDETVVLVEIPQYGEPQDLWVLRDARGSLSIIISKFRPDHPKWPGKFKGWPVPSLAYQRESADIAIEKRKNYIDLFKKLSDEMRSDPDKTAKRMWEISEEYDRASIVGYAGYKDKNYQKFLIRKYTNAFEASKKMLKQMQADRP